jgi:hypothetical protein
VNAAAVANEFAKMRHHKVGVITAVTVIAVVALTVVNATASPGFYPGEPGAWNHLLARVSAAVPMTSPLMVAVLASRHVDIEHQGGGWLLAAASGLTPGGMCRSKFIALGAIVAAVTVAQSLLVVGSGAMLGISDPLPAGRWLGFVLCMAAVNLVLLALHIVVAAKVENQLIGMGIGAIGTLIAMFAPGLPAAFAHVTPWGYYALAQAAGYEGTRLVPLPIAYPSIAALTAVTGVLFVLTTHRFDRQEA